MRPSATATRRTSAHLHACRLDELLDTVVEALVDFRLAGGQRYSDQVLLGIDLSAVDDGASGAAAPLLAAGESTQIGEPFAFYEA
jgi:hypothetical protein